MTRIMESLSHKIRPAFASHLPFLAVTVAVQVPVTVKRVRANSHASSVGVQVDWVALKVAKSSEASPGHSLVALA